MWRMTVEKVEEDGKLEGKLWRTSLMKVVQYVEIEKQELEVEVKEI